ncbi:MAG: aspartate aminotransferase family protein [Labilithrix sp.]|nr:aspartate aminotransferase family protein [Labilithrix sp.]
MKIPQQGTPRDEITKAMRAYRDTDADAARARLFSLVYATRPDVLEVAKEAFTSFFSENALNPMAFPSLRRMETEAIAMTLDLLNAPEGAAGSMTSGGSESLLLAMKTARDWARVERPKVTRPEVLLPVTAHPALFKAAHMLDLRVVVVPMTAGFGADAAAARSLVTDDTILVVGSAPQYPHGVIDPIAELAAIAEERGILCHVDACFGGFMLPWVEKLGHPVPPFDFRVPGVTSISADLHKYGYAAKGASSVLYRSRALRRHQFYVHADWPGGLFVSPGVLGTRPGGAIAAAWAVLKYLGQDGYLDLAKRAMSATRSIASGVREIPGLEILGEPAMSAIAIGARATGDEPPLDIYVIGDLMQARGWFFDRGQAPANLHLTVSPAHEAIAGEFLGDLRECVATARASKEQPQGKAALYGMLGSLPDRAFVRDALLELMDSLDADGGSPAAS